MIKAIDIQNASWTKQGKTLLKNVNGYFEQGSLTAIIGPNGAGKTTLVKGILGLNKPASGQVLVAPHLKQNMSLLAQTGAIDKTFPMTVYDLVALGAWRRIGSWRGYSRQEKEYIEHAMECVGIASLSNRLIGNLSGGELQRALFARVIMGDAKVIILDEPFAAVDEHTQVDLMKIICAWHQQGKTVITVIHDVDCVLKYFPNSLLLAGEMVGWGPTDQVLVESNFHKVRHLALKGF